ncbi:MAG: hypothetical protein J5804_00475, partial [Eggerthellaceae bacterium]|nr:hypothetical protein [Eggerthellaceae bacterium]
MSEESSQNQYLCMIGTDHTMATVDMRSALTISAEERDVVLPLLKVRLGASGVVLLSTCNRTELWASFAPDSVPDRRFTVEDGPASDDPLMCALASVFNVDPVVYSPFFASRVGESAVEHLFHVACGLRSAIVAEDQVVSQVKQAIAVSREAGVADSYLEVLFRQAVTTAKKVKTGVRFTRAYATAVEQAVAMLEEQGWNLSQTNCMVIGNGEYGRLAASTLVERGASVMVTVRQYTHGAVQIPHGCTGIPYERRYEYLDECQVVMSATTSPHYTLDCNRFERSIAPDANITLFDLAIPRDIDPKIGDVKGCR